MSTLLQRLELDARKYYSSITPAFAYICERHGDKEVRVEAPDVMQVFSGTISFGRDIQGFLYFHSLSDFDGDMQYHVSIHSDDSVKEEVVVISFWAEEDDVTKHDPYAKFIAPVPTHAWGKFKSFKKVGGQWDTLDEAQASAHAVCRPNKRDVTITIKPLGKKFDFQIPQGERLPDTGFDCHGSLVVTDIKELTIGPEFYVDYTNTRILILEKRNRHPVAMFSALEPEPNHPLVDIVFQTNKGKFSDISSGGPSHWHFPGFGHHAE
jgi:hypothetical protein